MNLTLPFSSTKIYENTFFFLEWYIVRISIVPHYRTRNGPLISFWFHMGFHQQARALQNFVGDVALDYFAYNRL
jgi:hypothetical protein